jgi:hypothetical protein
LVALTPANPSLEAPALARFGRGRADAGILLTLRRHGTELNVAGVLAGLLLALIVILLLASRPALCARSELQP